MKTRAVICLVAALSVSALAQGTVNFANFSTYFNAPVVLCDGGTKVGPPCVVGLVAGLSAGTLAFVTTTSFVAPGYFSGGTVSIPGVPGGSNAVWYSQCLHRGCFTGWRKIEFDPAKC